MSARLFARRRTLLPACTLLALLPVARPVRAQSGSDIFLALVHDAGGRMVVDSVRRVTQRPGYDNQPAFLPGDGGLLYTVIDASGQADIWRYDLRSGRSVALIHTQPESEYSATVMPAGDRISVIRVERDSAQRLWSFTRAGTDPRVVLETLKPVGYHAWIDGNRLALFVLGNPATLQLADVRTGEARVVAQNIGRSLHKVPGRDAVSFVQLGAEKPGWIRILDVQSGTATSLVQPFAENEYHAWTPDGVLLTARGSVLYALRPGRDKDWVEVADLAGRGVRGISRIAVSADGRMIALVAEE